MKKYFKLPVLIVCMGIFVTGFSSCDDKDDSVDNTKEEQLKPIVENYVNNVVIVTYRNLADASFDLYDKLKALKVSKTDANVKAAAKAWKESREHWELSEAFLFGAVKEYGIDPHIDTWPLDEEGFKRIMASKDILANLDKEDGDLEALQHFDESLLGFHGIEYILFKDGAEKKASELTTDELIYAVAVGGDLRNNCVRLEASWAGINNVSAEKKKLIEAKDLVIVDENTKRPYGDSMLKPEGTTYVNLLGSAAHILEYAFVIADEVGNVKIGTAANESASDKDRNYIESPYSYNSLKDFTDNIKSIENVYYGRAYGKQGPSISDYIASVDADADKAVKDAITASYAAIKAIPAPFVSNFTSAEADKAVKVIGETLGKALTRAKSVLYED